MPVLAIIQARLGSTRLPQKALAYIGARTLIDHVYEHALLIQRADHVVLAVPAGQGHIHPWATEVPGVAETDVLGRLAAVAEQWPDHETLVRVTGDCPLLNPQIADDVIASFLAHPNLAYVWNVTDGYVDGEDVEVFSREALLRAHREATDAADREHVTPWMRRHYDYLTVRPIRDGRGLKTSVDTFEDLERVRDLYATSR